MKRNSGKAMGSILTGDVRNSTEGAVQLLTLRRQGVMIRSAPEGPKAPPVEIGLQLMAVLDCTIPVAAL